jgi:hypothetical protein
MSKSSAEKIKNNRKKILPGYPITIPFNSIDDVREYISKDRITCLLCGKTYKKLGNHLLAIHETTVDEYRNFYHIPWTYGLLCPSSEQAYSKAILKRIDEGFIPPMKVGEEQINKLAKSFKRKKFYGGEIGLNNLGNSAKPKYPLTIAPDGSLETFTDRKIRLQTKRGTSEFQKVMRARAQCQPEVIGKRFGSFWKGRKQTQDHIKKRFANKKQNIILSSITLEILNNL